MESTSNSQPKKKSLLRNGLIWKALSLALSVGLMIFVLTQIDFAEFWAIVNGLPVWGIVGAIAFYFLLNVFRALRFRAFIPQPRPAIPAMIPIVFYHNFLTRVLPFKTGEISYVILLNRHLNQPVSEGISSLLSARLFELALVLLGGAFGLLSVASEGMASQRWLYFGVLIVLLLIYILALYQAGTILRLMARVWVRLIAPRLVRRFPTIEGRVEEKLRQFAGQFERIHNHRLLLTVVSLTFCTYSMAVLFEMVLMRAVGVELPFGVMLAIVSMKMLFEAAPVPTSGWGVIEGSWMLGLVNLGGLTQSDAAGMALFLHTAQVIIAGLLGLGGWFILSRRGKGSDSPVAPHQQTAQQ
jgi:hypothetical protein